jgi:hypothetical protein
MYVVTFENYTPAPRATGGTPWTEVRIEEAPLSTGPWTQIDVKYLSPVDTDPANPQGRDFTTELATLEQGWYRVIFADADGDTSQPSEPLLNAPSYILPTTREVADKLYLRTVTRGNVYLGIFDETTSPKDSQVQRYISQAFDEVYGRIGVVDNPLLARKARETITLYAAMTVEQSHYPEQIRSGRSAYPEFKKLFDDNMEVLTAAAGPVVDTPTGGGPTSGSPNYGFPETSIGDGVMP